MKQTVANPNISAGHGNAYSLDIDGYWTGVSPAQGRGVLYQNITFSNWKGTEQDGSIRGPIRIACPDAVPCADIHIEDFSMWTEAGSLQWYSCRSAFGTGMCLRSGNRLTSYAASTTMVKSAPPGYTAPTMAADLEAGFGFTEPIPIPTIPASFYPGLQRISRPAED